MHFFDHDKAFLGYHSKSEMAFYETRVTRNTFTVPLTGITIN